MKICILAVGRCGSTSLFNCIYKHLGKDYTGISEPFNKYVNKKTYESNFQTISDSNNVLIKVIVDIKHIPSQLNEREYFEWLFGCFDKIILLDRIDETLQLESFAYHTYTNSKHWHIKKRYDIDSIPKEYMDNQLTYLRINKNKLKELSLTYNTKIYFYEDIFLKIEKKVLYSLLEYIGIQPNNEIIKNTIDSKQFKVRIEDSDISLI